MRTFAYCRVSTVEQNPENQIGAIRQAGYEIQDHRVVVEHVSGSVEARKRPEFRRLVDDKLEPGDRLIVLKLDRLGRDAIDVQQTIEALHARQLSVVSLDLPTPDLTSANGKLILQMFAAFAEFERNRIRERTAEGLERARREGRRPGRPRATDTTAAVQRLKLRGYSQRQVARELGKGLATVKRHWHV
ncbi:recombinase family protein [Halorhodospira halophila]|uniref:recombinase family protein n=1 Tax=Halorhodospira halophila TaxID=1053 RepID=UPI001912873A|nr:resolvase [Halorhodospira halophila]